MSMTSSHLAHKAFRPCKYFGHTAWQPAQFTWSSIPSLLRSSPMPRHRGWALQCPRIVNDWQRSFVAASVLDFAILITSLEDLVTDTDDKLLNLILYSKHHVLHSILPDRSDFNYNLRPRCHNLVLTAKSSSMTDRDYITRMVFKNIYWCWHIHLLLFSLASTCLGLGKGNCYCLPLYIFFLIHFSICIHFTWSCCGLSLTGLKSWLIDWLILITMMPDSITHAN